jgi:hypothetical protein
VLDSSEDEDDAPTPPKLPSPAPSVARHVPSEPLGPNSSPAHLNRPNGELRPETEEESVEKVGPFVGTPVGEGVANCVGAVDEEPGGATEMGSPAGERSPTRTPEPETRNGAESLRTPELRGERPILRWASVTDQESIPVPESGSLGVAERRKESLVAPESAKAMAEKEARDESSDSDDVPIAVRKRVKIIEVSTAEGIGGGNSRLASHAKAEKQHTSARKKKAGRHERAVGRSILPGSHATAGKQKSSAPTKKADSRGGAVDSGQGANGGASGEGCKRRGARGKKGESDRLAVLALRAPPRPGVDRGGEDALVREGGREEVAAWADSLLEEPESESHPSQVDACPKEEREQELGGGDTAGEERAAGADEVLAEKGDSGRTFGEADRVTGREQSGAIEPAEWGGAADIPLDSLTSAFQEEHSVIIFDVSSLGIKESGTWVCLG